MLPEERRTVAVVALIHGLVHGNILAIPVFLDLSWRAEFAAGDVTLGLLAALAYACFGLGSVPFGHLADRHGAPRLLAVCVAGIVASLGLLALAPGLPGLAAALALLGLFSGIYHPTGLSLVSRAIRAQGRGMGWHGMGGSLGVALGPAAVGGLLALGWPWRSVVAVLLVPALVALSVLLASRLRDPLVAPGGRPLRASARGLVTGALGLVLLAYGFAGVAYWGSLTFLPRFVGAGSYVVLLGLGAVGQVASGSLADRARPERILLALSLAAAALLGALAVPALRGFAGIPWAFGLLLFSLEPLQNTLVAAVVRPESRGLAFGMTFLSVFGIGSSGAVLAGYLLSLGAAEPLFAILGAFLASSGVSGLLGGRRIRDPGSRARPSS